MKNIFVLLLIGLSGLGAQGVLAQDCSPFIEKELTIGGLHGKIIDVAETTFLIETEGGGKLRFEKSAIQSNGVQAEALTPSNS